MSTELRGTTRYFSVLHLILDSGERLPCLVDAETQIPVRLATRWAVRYRRLRVQASTLADNLRILGRMYTWASGEFDLDDYLTSGKILSVRQIESLAAYLRMGRKSVIPGIGFLKNGDDQPTTIIGSGVYDHYLTVVEEFLKWALDSANRGGVSALTLEALSAERSRLQSLFDSLRIGAPPTQRIEPLGDQEIQVIREAIGPRQCTNANWVFPTGIFSASTRLRNWLMFEVALQLGLRRGELLKLRLDSLPRGSDDYIRVLRHPDDPYDSRPNEPAVKTAERAIPVTRKLLSNLRAYLTMPQPFGRVQGKSPYLFVTRRGYPVSLDTAQNIITLIGQYSSVSPLSWHRLRHTWAEKWAECHFGKPNSMERLMYLGGWTNPDSPRHYIQRAIAQQAMQELRDYQDTLYEDEK